MSALSFVLSSLRHHWRIQTAVLLGVAVCTAVLTGALLIGDSMRGSLRDLALDRLGRIDQALLAPHFFRQQLGDEIQPAIGNRTTAPAILIVGTVENPDVDDADGVARVGQVNVLATDERFWQLGDVQPDKLPEGFEIALNEPLARALSVEVGQEVLLRLPTLNEIPADSPLGRKTETVQSRRFTVVAIVPAEGLGQFTMQPSQQAARNAYVPLATMQRLLDRPERVNAVFLSTPNENAQAPTTETMQAALRPTLEDYGLSLQHVRVPEDTGATLDYFQLISNGMLLPDAATEAALRAFAPYDPQPTFTYLANTIAHGDNEIPYSTITGLESMEYLAPEGESIGNLHGSGIVLNSWAAEDLGVKPRDLIVLRYFEPESSHGEVRERTESFYVRAIVPLASADEAPLPANDPDLTPELPGVTDQASIDDWNPPFPFDQSRVRQKDEDYWDDHRTTPKAFVTLATARKLWGSRFGTTTAVRVMAAEGVTEEQLRERLLAELTPAAMDLAYRDLRGSAVSSSSGTTPFDGLFLGFSFFIIAAAVMLVALLYRLGVEQRASEIGLLVAVGLRRSRVRRLLLLEGIALAAVGGVVGLVGGVGYAWLMLAGLRTWWLEAITTPFLTLHVTARSFAIGWASGVFIALLTIAWALRQMRRVAPRRLLAGAASEASFGRRPSYLVPVIASVCLLAAVGVAFVAWRQTGEAQALAFFGSGALVLVGALLLIWTRLRAGAAGQIAPGGPALTRLAARNGARNPGRSTLTVGLMAAASFLLVAISAFRLEPPSDQPQLDSGDGGFALLAQTSQPIYQNLNTREGRSELAFNRADEQLLSDTEIFGLRMHAGDDASCLNLYSPTQPTVVGLPRTVCRRNGFEWAETAGRSAWEDKNPFVALNKSSTSGEERAIPVILDQATANYSMHLGGVGTRFTIDHAGVGKRTYEIVGLLKNSIFQGQLLISEPQFLRAFPDSSGYRMFLVDTQQQDIRQVSQTLEKTLGDYGFDAELTRDRLASLMAVQNTYLSTFQSLGGLGLLLGTLGLAVVQLRSVFERRRELALLRAAGFRRSRLGGMVMLENSLLLLGGLATGIVAALVAILPHLIGGRAGIPWLSLVVTLGIVLAFGLLAGLAAVRATLRAPLIPALRGE